MKRWRKTTRK